MDSSAKPQNDKLIINKIVIPNLFRNLKQMLKQVQHDGSCHTEPERVKQQVGQAVPDKYTDLQQ